MNYPSGVKHNKTKEINYSNRGMTLEEELNSSNEYYREIDKAIIYKKPTPIKITKVDYPSRSSTVIKEAFFTTPSTTDYNGIYKGYYIDYEAKETKSKTSFSLNNIHSHQIDHLKRIKEHGGISFIIVRFTTCNKTYLLETNPLCDFIDNNKRKSIPIEYFEKNGYLIKDSLKPVIDYLKVIDYILEVNYGKTCKKKS